MRIALGGAAVGHQRRLQRGRGRGRREGERRNVSSNTKYLAGGAALPQLLLHRHSTTEKAPARPKRGASVKFKRQNTSLEEVVILTAK
jgi:hypothetical protein